MKTTQYVRQEKAIASADAGGIFQRWLWGLRLLRDPEAFAPGSSQLKPGLTDQLAAAYKAKGLKLSRRETSYRLQCARTYQTEAQIHSAMAAFDDWTSLRTAGFPAYDRNPDEPLADHRTASERAEDRARTLAELADSDQLTRFPLRRFEPTETALAELEIWLKEQDEITASFVQTSEKRRAYLEDLKAAVEGDLTTSWWEAHVRLADSGT